MPAPSPEKRPERLEIHGHERIDPYFWMRDDTRENPEVRSHLEAENRYTREVLEDFKGQEEALFEEIKGRIKKDDRSVPYKDRNFWYYKRYEAEKEHALYCRRRDSMESPEEILLDVNQLAEEHKFYSLGRYSVSDDEQILAFTEDTVSRRLFTLRFKDLRTGELLPDRIEGIAPMFSWAADNKTVFYVEKDPKTLREYRVFRHVLGTDPSTDTIVYTEEDTSFFAFVYRCTSRRFIEIKLYSTLVTESRVIEADRPNDDFRVVLPRAPEITYDIEHSGEVFYIRINDGAPNFRVVAAPIEAASDRATWREVIPHSDSVLLSWVQAFRDHLVLVERRDALQGIRIIGLRDGAEHRIDFDDEVYVAWPNENPDSDTTRLRFLYGSLVTPDSVYEYDMDSHERILLKQDVVLGGFAPEDYITERMWVTARDGEKVPLSIVRPRNFVLDGSGIVYQYAYGSYGSCQDPWIRQSLISLLDRGIAVAFAHVRGGQELGRRWYDSGRMFEKKNTFYDFIDCSEGLIQAGYTRAGRILAEGGSAGGLLIGAVANLRPDLYAAMHAAVPFVDVVTTMLDETLPLTTAEYNEWGNPNHPDSYHYMLSYSPYDQVCAQDYPPVIATTGFHDSQVQYWEPAKWVAKLRDHKTNDGPVLLDVNLDAGHGGATGRFSYYKTTARVYSFFFRSLEPTPERWRLPAAEAKTG